ncbi:MAG TPA: ferredoxin [Actinomycetota bacterium]|nr:ferredoxin [Actinomycetota bacterium]
MSVRVRIDRTRCIGAETCIQLAPTAFKWRDEELGKADLLDPASVEDDLLREAAAACPTLAIILTEEDDPAQV